MIICGKALTELSKLKTESVQTCVTSPPYYGLRDYQVEGQIGLEETPEEYIEKLVVVFREVKRVLKKDGTLWVNMGESYAGSGKGGATHPENAKHYKQGTNHGMIGDAAVTKVGYGNCKPKDMIGTPWMLAFALRADGWYLRQDIIWAKPNPMPESVKDRCTKSHEYIFLLSKSKKYYYDHESIKEDCVGDENAKTFRGGAYCNQSTFINSEGGKRKEKGNYKTPAGWDVDEGSHGTIHREGRTRYGGKKYTENPDVFFRTKSGDAYKPTGKRNKRDVWTVATRGFKEAHFATFQPELIEPCILAGSRIGDVVIDPFSGSGTVGVVCEKYDREYIGIELNADYVEIQQRRIAKAVEEYYLQKNQLKFEGVNDDCKK